MQVLALVTDAFGGHGGIARYNCDLLTALSQSSRVSRVVSLPRIGSPITEADTPIKVRQLRPVPSKASWSMQAIRLVAQHRFDVIFCGHINAVPLGAFLSISARIPLWLQVHGVDAWEPRGKLYRKSLARAKLITSVSRYTRQKLLDWSELVPSRVRILPNTVEPHYGPRPRRSDLVQKHNLGGKRVILTVGRLSEAERYKGHDRVIAAMPSILARVPNAVYMIVGMGEDQLRLKRLANELGVDSSVLFAGLIPHEQLPDYFALADVFVMPSTGEGFGIVFLEAAAMGLPVVGGNQDGSVDALAEGKIGRLINPMSKEEIAAALVAALEGRQTTDITAVQRFRFENFAKHVHELLEDLVR